MSSGTYVLCDLRRQRDLRGTNRTLQGVFVVGSIVVIFASLRRLACVFRVESCCSDGVETKPRRRFFLLAHIPISMGALTSPAQWSPTMCHRVHRAPPFRCHTKSSDLLVYR